MGKRTDNDNTIHECHNLSTFVKVKPAFPISKIVFSFVEYDKSASNKRKKDIECYMSVAEAGLLAKKITSGRMYNAIENERRKGQEYPDPVWKSPLGGMKEAFVKAQGLRTDGKAISRRFTIAPGSKKYAVLTATQCAGYTDESGLIVPIANDPNKTTIRVALESWDEVEKLGIMLEAAVYAYMIKQTQKAYTTSEPDEPCTENESTNKYENTSAPPSSEFTGPPIVWPEDVFA